jgi:hypothetical protein
MPDKWPKKRRKALEDCGVSVGWDDDVWGVLRGWREIRNKFVHTLEMQQRTASLSSSAAQEVFWLVESAIRALDVAMTTLKPFTSWYEGHIQGEDSCPGCDFRGDLPKGAPGGSHTLAGLGDRAASGDGPCRALSWRMRARCVIDV